MSVTNLTWGPICGKLNWWTDQFHKLVTVGSIPTSASNLCSCHLKPSVLKVRRESEAAPIRKFTNTEAHIRVIDSSRYITTLHCKRERFIGYEVLGQGLAPQVQSEDLLFGLAIHAGAEAIILGKNNWEDETYTHIDKIQGVTVDGFSRKAEMGFMAIVMLLEFKERFLPLFRERYEILHTELEILHEFHPGYGWMSRPDLVVRPWGEETRLNVNYKTSSYPEDVLKQSKLALQLLMEAEAIRATTTDYVSGTIIIVFDKGYKSKLTKTEKEAGKTGYRRVSPLTYAWSTGVDEEDPTNTKWSLESKAKHFRVPMFNVMSTHNWWEWLDTNQSDVLRRQIFETPVIQHAVEKTESVKTQILEVERQVETGIDLYKSIESKHGKERILDKYFPQNFDNCLNHHGFRGQCPVYDFCHTVGVSEKPLYHYSLRVPNHPVEQSIIEARASGEEPVKAKEPSQDS